MKYQYTISPQTVAVWTGAEIKLYDKANPCYDKVRQACLYEDDDKLDELLGVNFKKKIEYVGFSYRDGVVFVNGEYIPQYLGQRLKAIADEGKDYQYALNFWHKVKENPSYHSVHQLFKFLEKNHFPFCPDGDFIAYKGVDSNLKDCHTHTFDNSPGQKISIPRRMVDDDFSKDCSYGLHVGNFAYASTFGARLVKVKVNPRDAVACNADEAFNKLRVCAYEVIEEITNQKSEPQEQVDDDYEYCADCDETIEDCVCDTCLGCGELNCVCDDEDWEDENIELDDEDDVIPIVSAKPIPTVWSEDEEDFLRKNYDKQSYELLGNNLGRTKESIRKKLKRMGLK